MVDQFIEKQSYLKANYCTTTLHEDWVHVKTKLLVELQVTKSLLLKDEVMK